MICPMKFNALSNPKFCELLNLDDLHSFIQCDEEHCAWYSQYLNNTGECAIHSLAALYDGLESISEMINRK